MSDIRRMLDHVVEQRCRSAGFHPVGPMADRHGTWQRVFTKAAGSLRRALILDITQPDARPRFDIQLSAAADDGQRFGRRVVERANGVAAVPTNVDQAVAHTLMTAESLGASDLREAYPESGGPSRRNTYAAADVGKDPGFGKGAGIARDAGVGSAEGWAAFEGE